MKKPVDSYKTVFVVSFLFSILIFVVIIEWYWAWPFLLIGHFLTYVYLITNIKNKVSPRFQNNFLGTCAFINKALEYYGFVGTALEVDKVIVFTISGTKYWYDKEQKEFFTTLINNPIFLEDYADPSFEREKKYSRIIENDSQLREFIVNIIEVEKNDYLDKLS